MPGAYPTLVIIGTADLNVSVEAARSTAQLVHGARVEVMTEIGHVPNIKAPDAINALIRRFLAEAGTSMREGTDRPRRLNQLIVVSGIAAWRR